MNDKKGIELISSNQESHPTITIGDKTIKPKGQPLDVHFEKQNAYVYLVIDTSGSMAGDKLRQAKSGVLDFAKDAFRKEYQVGLISFNTNARNLCDLTLETVAIQRGVTQLNASGSTNMAEAVKLAHDRLKHFKSTRFIVIATDGLPDNAQDALQEGRKAKDDGIEIIAIGTDDADNSFLKKLASKEALGQKVSREVFAQTIVSASNLLPSPKGLIKR